MSAMTEFAEWLDAELRSRGLNRAQLAAYMNRPAQTVYAWFTDGRTPRPDICLDIARVLHVEADEVLRHAGHLPRTTDTTSRSARESVPSWLADLIAGLDDAEQRMLGATARELLRLREDRGPYEGRPRFDTPPPPAGPEEPPDQERP